jgi:hypothetical protein
MNIRDQTIDRGALKRDATPTNLGFVAEYRRRIWRYACGHPVFNAADVYRDLELLDIPMYLALHSLVNCERLEGVSPYADESATSHHEMVFKRIPQPLNLMEAAATGGL